VRPVFILAALFYAVAASAQVHRWVDDKGTVHYSDSAPPQGVKSVVLDIDTTPGPAAPDTTECYTVRCQGERMEERIARRDALDSQAKAERIAASPRPVRGLEFRKYISIQRGMTEGELLNIAGEPDLVAHQGDAISAPTTVQIGRRTRGAARTVLSMTSYTYLPTPGDPFTTTITLVGGRVSEIERERKF
jgi:hypothetical protein